MILTELELILWQCSTNRFIKHQPMWTLDESLHGGFMILLGFIVIILARKIAAIFRKDDIDLTKMNDIHSWSELDALLKTYTCCVCSNILTGSCGKQCDNCGICCHDACMKSASKVHSCKDVYSSGEECDMKHHWVKDGNMDHFEYEDVYCCVCDEECIETESSISQCCWCQRTRHSSCELTTSNCDFGSYRNFIIPPFCVTPTKSSRLDRKFKVKCLSHPGWDGWSPVIVLANRRAGNSDGAYLLSHFRRLLNPCQVLDLAIHSPSLVVKWCSVAPADVTLYIIVAGGDGTVAWVLNTLNECKTKGLVTPPIGVIPLGTGNDLSRVLGWGKAYSRGITPASYLKKISRSSIVDLDRWRIDIKSLSNISIPRATSLNCYNYFSIGVDAKVALDFHQTRQTSSLYLSSRLYNKLLYTIFGTRQVVVPDYSCLQNRLELFIDGVKITSIPDVESIVIVNIPSWAAGVKLWNQTNSALLPQEIDDGKLEVVGLYSSFHIAQLQIGLSEPYYIGQGSEVKIILHEKLPIQADGEPWIQKPAEIKISFCNQAKVLKVQ